MTYSCWGSNCCSHHRLQIPYSKYRSSCCFCGSSCPIRLMPALRSVMPRNRISCLIRLLQPIDYNCLLSEDVDNPTATSCAAAAAAAHLPSLLLLLAATCLPAVACTVCSILSPPVSMYESKLYAAVFPSSSLLASSASVTRLRSSLRKLGSSFSLAFRASRADCKSNHEGCFKQDGSYGNWICCSERVGVVCNKEC